MSKEILNGIESLYKSSGNGTIAHSKDLVTITGNTWVNQISEKGVEGDYIEIDPTATFYYDIIYSNQAGNNFYIGFERFDADKTATSNSSTTYIIASTAEAIDKRIVGTVNLATNSSGNPTKYIRLRILNNWSGSSISNGVAEIKMLSLLQNKTDTSGNIQETGIINSDFFRESHLEKTSIFKNEGVEANQFIEI